MIRDSSGAAKTQGGTGTIGNDRAATERLNETPHRERRGPGRQVTTKGLVEGKKKLVEGAGFEPA